MHIETVGEEEEEVKEKGGVVRAEHLLLPAFRIAPVRSVNRN